MTPSAPLFGATISLQDDVQPIFNSNCIDGGCHVSPTYAATMSLEGGDTFDVVLGIVNVVSSQVPPLKRVEPGDASASYLIDKIEDTNPSVGLQMPRLRPMLSPTEILIIREWIIDGAQDN